MTTILSPSVRFLKPRCLHFIRAPTVMPERPRARILLEASTESEWDARHLESLGHEVIVADPNYAPI